MASHPDELLFNPVLRRFRSSKSLNLDTPVSPELQLNPSEGIAAKTSIPALAGPSQQPQQEERPIFERAFGDTNKGILPVPVSGQEVLDEGGIKALQETRRGDTLIISDALDITNSLLGKVNRTQQADPENLSKFSKVLLFVSNIVAVGEGRTPPGLILDAQSKRAFTLEEQAGQQSYINGLDVIHKMVNSIASSPRDQRQKIMESMIPQLERFGEGLGAIGLVLTAKPNERDAMTMVLNREDLFRGTMAEQFANYTTAIAAVDGIRAADLWEWALKNEIFSTTIDNVGPTEIANLKDRQISEGLRQGGDQAKFANAWASGSDITPEQYSLFNEKLSIGNQTNDAVLESYLKAPERYWNVFPGQMTSDLVEKQKILEQKGEFSAPVAMVNSNDPSQRVGGPNQSARIRALGPEWLPMAINHDALFGKDGGGGVFGAPTPATTTQVQKELFELRATADELVGIEEGFDKFLQTNRAKAENFVLGQIEAFGGELSPENEAFRKEFIFNKAATLTSLSNTLNRLSGAAVSPQEFERIQNTRPSDQDDPGEFEAKLEASIALTMFAIARWNVWRLQGNNQVGKAFNLRRRDVRSFITQKLIEVDDAYRDSRPDIDSETRSGLVSETVAREMGVRVRDLSFIQTGLISHTLLGDPP